MHTHARTDTQGEVKRLAEQQNKLAAWKEVLGTVENDEGKQGGGILSCLRRSLPSLLPSSPPRWLLLASSRGPVCVNVRGGDTDSTHRERQSSRRR